MLNYFNQNKILLTINRLRKYVFAIFITVLLVGLFEALVLSPEDYKQELHNYAKQNHKNIEIVYVEVPAGGATFHHGNTWHGSGVNNSLQDRRAIVSHCVPYNAKFHPTNTGGTGRIYRKYKKNDSDELDISFFPLLWKKNKFKQKNNER